MKSVAVLMKKDPSNVNGWIKVRDLSKADLKKKYKSGFKVLTSAEYEAWYNQNIAPYYVPQKNEE